MPQNTFTLIEKITVGAAGASSITFTSIPQTYTDLKIVVSARDTTDNLPVTVSFNGSAIDSSKTLKGNGAGAFSASETVFWITPSSATASTFGSAELYIPNYTGSTAKSMSVDSVTENNSTTAYIFLAGQLENGTSAITSVTLTPTGTFAQYSTAYLYGIAKEGVSPSPSSAPYATGGDSIVFDGTYWIHTFTSSGTFTPKKGLTCDVLTVAGGGGGRNYGGGGAGQVLETLSRSFISSTAYTVTVGAGGSALANGNDTTITGSGFTTITSSKGLVGTSETGANSGGTSGNGNAGGTGYAAPNPWHGGGGGGASAVGANATSTTAGNGGNGLASSLSGSSVTYGGGGGGGCEGSTGSSTRGTGGTGGGGNGSGRVGNPVGSAGTANLGGGGGGGDGNNTTSGFAGGSGVVIVRYAA